MTEGVNARRCRSVVMARQSPSKTGVNALMSRPSTSCFVAAKQDVDARRKAGHDGAESRRRVGGHAHDLGEVLGDGAFGGLDVEAVLQIEPESRCGWPEQTRP